MFYNSADGNKYEAVALKAPVRFRRDGKDYQIVEIIHNEVCVLVPMPYAGEGIQDTPCWWPVNSGCFVPGDDQ